MADKTTRAQAQQKLSEQLVYELDKAINAKDADKVLSLSKAFADSSVELAETLDRAETELSAVKQTVAASGKKALPANVLKMVNEKVILGLPYEDAVEVSLRQAEYDKTAKHDPPPKAS